MKENCEHYLKSIETFEKVAASQHGCRGICKTLFPVKSLLQVGNTSQIERAVESGHLDKNR
jgi:hypothetical protein